MVNAIYRSLRAIGRRNALRQFQRACRCTMELWMLAQKRGTRSHSTQCRLVNANPLHDACLRNRTKSAVCGFLCIRIVLAKRVFRRMHVANAITGWLRVLQSYRSNRSAKSRYQERNRKVIGSENACATMVAMHDGVRDQARMVLGRVHTNRRQGCMEAKSFWRDKCLCRYIVFRWIGAVPLSFVEIPARHAVYRQGPGRGRCMICKSNCSGV